MPITDRDKKTLVIGGSVVGFFLLVFLIYTLFLSGGNDAATSTNTGSVLGPLPTVGASPTPTPTPTGGGGVVTFGGHDPFCIPQSYVSRLVLLHLPLDANAYYCPGVFVPSPSPSVSPSPSGSGTPSPTPSVPSSPIRSSAIVGGRTVVLMAVPTSPPGSRAQVQVDGKVYNVAVGTTFAGDSLQLQGVSGRCASFLYGDQAFSLCHA